LFFFVFINFETLYVGEHSKISLNTRNVFIECTATDLHKAEVVLDTIVSMFSEYCQPRFEVEAVEIIYEGRADPRKHIYPTLCERVETVNTIEINQKIGINIDDKRMAELLSRMGLVADVTAQNKLSIRIPPTRSDILHACDIMEDVAIGYGYNNIKKTIPASNCFSEEVELLFNIYFFSFGQK
jgi:phenylalanyl-tRNA synthetase beta chain